MAQAGAVQKLRAAGWEFVDEQDRAYVLQALDRLEKVFLTHASGAMTDDVYADVRSRAAAAMDWTKKADRVQVLHREINHSRTRLVRAATHLVGESRATLPAVDSAAEELAAVRDHISPAAMPGDPDEPY